MSERIQPRSIELGQALILILRVHPLHSVEIDGRVLEDDGCVLVAAVGDASLSIVWLLVCGLLFVYIAARRLRLLSS